MQFEVDDGDNEDSGTNDNDGISVNDNCDGTNMAMANSSKCTFMNFMLVSVFVLLSCSRSFSTKQMKREIMNLMKLEIAQYESVLLNVTTRDW